MTAGTDAPATEPAGSNRARACRRAGRPRTPIRGAGAVAAPGGVPTRSTSGLEYDLVVLGYLSAVARELERRQVAESRLRLPPRRDGAGSLDLEPISRCADRQPVRLTWDARSGWCVLLRDGSGHSLTRRGLHPVVAEPARVADFAALAAGARDDAVVDGVVGGVVGGAGVPSAEDLDPEDLDPEDLDPEDLDPEDLDPEDLDPEDLDPEDLDEDGADRERVVVALARFALPEIRRWLDTGQDPGADRDVAGETV